MTQRKGTYPIALGLLRECALQLFKTEITLTVVNTDAPTKDDRFVDHVIAEVHVLSKHKCRRVTTGSRTDSGKLLSKRKIRIGREQFQNMMPYGVSFDSKLQIRTAGINILTLCPNILDKNMRMNDVFRLLEPQIEFSYDKMIKTKINSFYMKFKLGEEEESEKEKGIILKGPLLHIEDDKEVIFMGAPHYDSLADFSACSALMSVIPSEALTIEILFMYNQRKADMEMSKELDATTAKLQKLAISLEEEKKKTDTLLYQMLPYKVANQLREGKPVEAEKYESVTILFSDIVSFTLMSSKTEPMDTVKVLNQLFHKFDTLSNRHGVYKVETIGDAYMVVSGVPELDEDHAERLSNMAIDMIWESKTVLNPYTKLPLQIRVGMHSGPVVTGVVGIKMPRFCLFGDTVNTASRMESSGIPGKIHISEATCKYLKEADFVLQPRGHINVKGKGKMMTYFITGNGGKVIPDLTVDVTSNVCSVC